MEQGDSSDAAGEPGSADLEIRAPGQHSVAGTGTWNGFAVAQDAPGATCQPVETISAPANSLPTTLEGKIAEGQRLKEEGNRLLKEGDLQGAAKSYRFVFAYVNGLVGSGDNMAQYTQKSDMMNDEQKKQVEEIKTASYSNLSLVYLKQDKFEKALQAADDAIASNEKFVKAFVRKSEVLLKLKKFQKAVETLQQAHKIEPENSVVKAHLDRAEKVNAVFQKQQAKKQAAALKGMFDK